MRMIASWFRSALSIVGTHKRPYIGTNVAYYGLVATSMLFVANHPEIQEQLIQAVVLSFTQGPMAAVADAYSGGHVLQAAALTFGFNLILGSVVVLFMPSLLIPFAGVFIGLVRAALWGLLLAPTTPDLQAAMIPHSLTLILEGQGYILAMLAAWVLGRAFVSPSSVGASTRGEGYVRGLKNAALVYLLVATTLAAAAVYEALEVIYLVPLFVR